MAKRKKKVIEGDQHIIETTMDQTNKIVEEMIRGKVLNIYQIMDIVQAFAKVTQDAYPEHEGIRESILESGAQEIFVHCMLGE